jgi:putative transcriptional regulator
LGVERAMAIKVRVNINQLLSKNGISLRELSRLTDIGHAILSNLANQNRQRMEFSHMEKIAEALDIKDIREIIEFEESENE